MAYNYLNPGLRKQIINEIDSGENIDRKKVSLGQYEIYRDRILPYVKQYMSGFYRKETIAEMPIISTINLARRIANKEASIYLKEPKRTFTGVSEDQIKVLEDIYEDMKVNAILLKANQFYKLQDQAILQVITNKGDLKLRCLMPHQVDAVPSVEDPEVAEAYIVNGFDRGMYAPRVNGGDDGENQAIADQNDYQAKIGMYSLWSEQYNFIMDKSGNIVTGTDIENPLQGVLPFIDINGSKDGEFWVRTGAALTDFTIQFNSSLSDIAHIVRMQGFGQAWFKGAEDMMPESLQIGPNFVLRLPINPNNPVETDFGFATANADIAGSISFLETALSSFLTSRGMDPKLVNGKGSATQYSSGVERLLSMIESFEPSRSDFDIFRDVECKLFSIIRTYLNTYSGTDVLPEYRISPISEEADVVVEFGAPELIQTEAEKLENIRTKIELGLMSQSEAISDFRGVDMDEANKIKAEIEADNMMKGPVDSIQQ